MNKTMGILMIVLALVIAIVPHIHRLSGKRPHADHSRRPVGADEMSLDRHRRDRSGCAAGIGWRFQSHQQAQGNIPHAQPDRVWRWARW